MILALVHTTPLTLAPLGDLAREHLPGVRILNFLDDSLLPDVMQAGTVPPAVRGRLQHLADMAVEAGAQAAMSCCSSVGDAFTSCRAAIPLWRIDQAMAQQAAQYERIGVLATVETTLEPTANLIRGLGGKHVQARVVDGAYAALKAGNPDEHDRRVLAALRDSLEDSDVIVLAQASMARLLPQVQTDVPILTSPVSGLQLAYRKLSAR